MLLCPLHCILGIIGGAKPSSSLWLHGPRLLLYPQSTKPQQPLSKYTPTTTYCFQFIFSFVLPLSIGSTCVMLKNYDRCSLSILSSWQHVRRKRELLNQCLLTVPQLNVKNHETSINVENLKTLPNTSAGKIRRHKYIPLDSPYSQADIAVFICSIDILHLFHIVHIVPYCFITEGGNCPKLQRPPKSTTDQDFVILWSLTLFKHY